MRKRQKRPAIDTNDPANVPASARRRRILASLVTSGTVAGLLPGQWSRPVVQSVITPAHAQSSYVLTCEASPPAGSTVGATDDIEVVVTISPNPGPGQTVEVLGFCDDSSTPGFEDTETTDSSGRIMSGGNLVFCADGDEACVRFIFGGASVECCWNIAAESNCLAHGTPVLRFANTFVPVETLAVGYLVIGMDRNGAHVPTVVTKVVKQHLRNDFYTINGALHITGDHPVLVAGPKSLLWRRVDDLAVDDRIKSLGGFTTVRSIEHHEHRIETVYVETQCGNFFARGGGDVYAVKSSYATANARLEEGQEVVFT